MYLLMLPLMVMLVLAPAVVSAREDDDWEEREDEDESSLEVEASVFTDTTIVKVEVNDRKTIFATEADTKEEVVTVVSEKFKLTKEAVNAVLEFELEDRASRPQDRGKLNREIKHEKKEKKDKKWWGEHASTTPKVCRDNDTKLQVEADVFTDKTVVKVEFVNAKDVVFTTNATTSADIIAAVTSRYSTLSTSSIASALDIEVEDRASRPDDLTVDNDCKEWVRSTSTPNETTEAKLAELRARIAELQSILDRILNLMRGS
ncbi:MAG: hypothetical protein RLZZ360_406 [Candidatus Parcubacteria bacterium]